MYFVTDGGESILSNFTHSSWVAKFKHLFPGRIIVSEGKLFQLEFDLGSPILYSPPHFIPLRHIFRIIIDDKRLHRKKKWKIRVGIKSKIKKMRQR